MLFNYSCNNVFFGITAVVISMFSLERLQSNMLNFGHHLLQPMCKSDTISSSHFF